MHKKTKIVTIIIIVLVVFITSIDIITKGKITGLIGSVNPMNLLSSDVPYTNNNQSTVQGAIDDLYNKASTYINPNDFGLKTNSKKTVFASKAGVCIKRSETVHCFTTNNYDYEKEHIKSIFSDDSCNVSSYYVSCNASDFRCDINSSGDVYCIDESASSRCGVTSDGSVYCY